MQIIHVRKSHRVALEVAGSNDVFVYDSSYTLLSTDTQRTIAQLLHCKEKSITTHVMNVAKQSGVMDCALFAMAFTAHLAFGKDPTSVVFDQKELRSHLLAMLTSGKVSTFPVMKNRRTNSRVSRVESFDIHCHCRMPDDGDLMVLCETCNEWYHHKSIMGIESERQVNDGSWFCSKCRPAIVDSCKASLRFASDPIKDD